MQNSSLDLMLRDSENPNGCEQHGFSNGGQGQGTSLLSEVRGDAVRGDSFQSCTEGAPRALHFVQTFFYVPSSI